MKTSAFAKTPESGGPHGAQVSALQTATGPPPITPMRARPAPKERVYVIGPKGGPYKIGRTYYVRKRLAQLQTGNPYLLEVIDTVITEKPAEDVERWAHWLLRDHRLEGEWFDVTIEQAQAAIETAEQDARPIEPDRANRRHTRKPENKRRQRAAVKEWEWIRRELYSG